eukprot:Clim_evm3s80 gene=Clim_evmTU3s80
MVLPQSASAASEISDSSNVDSTVLGLPAGFDVKEISKAASLLRRLHESTRDEKIEALLLLQEDQNTGEDTGKDRVGEKLHVFKGSDVVKEAEKANIGRESILTAANELMKAGILSPFSDSAADRALEQEDDDVFLADDDALYIFTPSQQPHDFEMRTKEGSAICAICQQMIWDLTVAQCKLCSELVHKDCMPTASLTMCYSRVSAKVGASLDTDISSLAEGVDGLSMTPGSVRGTDEDGEQDEDHDDTTEHDHLTPLPPNRVALAIPDDEKANTDFASLHQRVQESVRTHKCVLDPSCVLKKENVEKDDPQYEIDPLPGSMPLLFLINRKSGGNAGGRLLTKLKTYMNFHDCQLRDLIAEGPRQSLIDFMKVPNHVVVVGGGDGSVGWVMMEMDKIDYPDGTRPAVAVFPLGTGNDLGRTLGSGGGLSRFRDALDMIDDIPSAGRENLDRWTVDVCEDGQDGPLCLGRHLVMNNYFSIGIDAHIALKFHEARESNPTRYSNQVVNKIAYAGFGARAMLRHKRLGKRLEVEVDGVRVEIPDAVEAIVVLNIPSYASGTHPWGTHKSKKYKELAIGDGFVEVLGIRSAVHQGVMQAAGGKITGTRLGQGKTVVVTLKKPMAMQLDGEPWLQTPASVHIQFHRRNEMIHFKKRKDKTHPIPTVESGTVADILTDASTLEDLKTAILRRFNEVDDAGRTVKRNAFLGVDCVNFIMFHMKLGDRNLGINIGQELLEQDFFHAVNSNPKFRDDKTYYRFGPPKKGGKEETVAMAKDIIGRMDNRTLRECLTELISSNREARLTVVNLYRHTLVEPVASDALETFDYPASESTNSPTSEMRLTPSNRSRTPTILHAEDIRRTGENPFEEDEPGSFVALCRITIEQATEIRDGGKLLGPGVKVGFAVGTKFDTQRSTRRVKGPNPIVGEEFCFMIIRSDEILSFGILGKTMLHSLPGMDATRIGYGYLPVSSLKPGQQTRWVSIKLDDVVTGNIKATVDYSYLNGTNDTGSCLGPEPLQILDPSTGGFKGLITAVSEANHIICVTDNVYTVAEPGEKRDDTFEGIFQYSLAPLKDSDVDIYMQPARYMASNKWVRLGMFTTDKSGRIKIPVPERVLQNIGHFRVRAVVRRDNSVASGSLFIVPKGAKFVIYDIDGTLSVGDEEVVQQTVKDTMYVNHDVKLRKGAVSLVQIWASKGYLPLYVSGRAGSFYNLTREWCERHGLPPGVIHHTSNHLPTLPTWFSVGRFKLQFMRNLMAQGYEIYAAYGNTGNDIRAYRDAGIPLERTFIVGPNQGKRGTQKAGRHNFVEHIRTYLVDLPVSDAPCPNKALWW